MTSSKATPSTKTESAAKSDAGKESRPRAFDQAGGTMGTADLGRELDLPQSLRSSHIRYLQRTIGNQAVAEMLMRQAAPENDPGGLAGGPATEELESGISRRRGGGRTMGKQVRAQMEQGFGVDFSGVRIHTGTEADRLSRSVQARAFTTGKDIFFKKDAYNPHSGDGRKLLAHELTHVVQQGAAPKVQRKLEVGPAKDRYEEEADRIARTVVQPKRIVQRAPAQAIQRDFKSMVSGAKAKIGGAYSNLKNSAKNSQSNRQQKKQNKAQGPKVSSIFARLRDEISDKSTKIVGKEGKRSIWSREESAKTLDMPVDERVQGILEVLDNETHATNAFKRVAFLMEGKVTGSLETAFQQASGQDLRSVIVKNFTKRPHPHSADYLLSVLDNDGEAPLKSRLWLTLGLVDSPAVDEGRLVTLAERAPYTEFKPVWIALKNDIQKRAGEKTYNRLQAYVDTHTSNEQLEAKKQAGLTVTTTDRNALAAARDRHLAGIVNFRSRELSSRAKAGLKLLKLATKIPMLVPLAPVPTMINAIGNSVATQKLSDDIIKWRQSAEQEDVVYIRNKGASSEFQKALDALPRVAVTRMSNLRGVTEAELNYFQELATADIGPSGDPAGKENTLKSSSIYSAIQREKATNSGSKAKVKATKFARGKLMGAGIWDALAPQILSMTQEQRDLLLNRYPGATRQDKLDALKVDLKEAGIGEDKVGPIVAVFDNTYDEAGPGYLALVDYVTKQTNVKSKFTKFKNTVTTPTKKGKSNKFGIKVLKLMGDLRGSEFAQVRQNQTLLQTIEANAGNHWYAVMRILGIADSTDQLTGANQQVISDAQQKAEQQPAYWATQIEILSVKAKGMGKKTFDYTPQPQQQPQQPGKKGKNAKPPAPKQLAIDKISLDKIAWVVLRAQAVARQVEETTQGNPDAAGFMMSIYNALQPETQAQLQKVSDTSVTDADKLKKAKKFEKIRLALTDQANHPLEADIAIDKTLKKAETKWYKRLWRPRPDRARLVDSFSKLEGKELVDQWSNFAEYKGLYDGGVQLEQGMQKLQGTIDNKKDAIKNETDPAKLKELQKELDVLYNRMIQMGAMRTKIQESMKGFVLGIRQERYQHLLKMTGLTSEDRLKVVAMLTEKIIAVSESDPDVQLAMALVEMPFDEWMKTKMRGVDAIEMQRYIDGSRQWHLFSNKSAQLDEGTRRVVGTIRSGNEEMREGEKQGKSVEELQALKSKYSQKGQEELSDRKDVEAAFKDMQAKFNARASLIIRIITTVLITAISAGISAASMGIATPIMIGINAGMLLGQIAVHAAFDYFVLKKPISQVAVEAGVAILQSALTLLSMNLATAMNASFLHPDLFLKGSEWIAPMLSKTLSKTILGIIMAYPKSVLKLAYDQQPLEEVVEKGKEKAMGKTLLMNLAKGAAKPWLKFVLKGAIGGAMYGVEQAKAPIHEGIFGEAPSTTGTTSTTTTPMPTPGQMVSNPGGSLSQGFESGKESAIGGVKGFLTPTIPQTPPKGDFGTTFISDQTFLDNTNTMVARLPKKLKKEAKKGAVGKGAKGGWLSSTTNTTQNRTNKLGSNREQFVKGMKLVSAGGTTTKLTTGVTTLTPDVHVVYFGGGWRLEDTGTPQTAKLNGEDLTGAVRLTPGDIVTIGGGRYDVQLGA